MLPLALLGAAPADDCTALTAASTPMLEVVRAAREGAACRVEAIARPRPRAAIRISLWLPPGSTWSGRYYQMGNGGFAGSIDRGILAAAAARGDVAAATDTGHAGTGFEASWARGRPDLIEDYATRSIKVTADVARDLIGRYYGRPAAHRYFMGCSFGGRQALVAASRWPADWDGVIAGAPAVRWIDWLVGMARIQHQLRAVPGGWIAPDRIAPLAAAARGRGGPGAALCRPGARAACSRSQQTRTLAVIERAGYRLADADPTEWTRWITNPDPATPSQARFATEAFRNLFGRGPNWTLAGLLPGDDAPGQLKAQFAVGDLSPFVRKGGRVFVYVGTADAVLPPAGIVDATRNLLQDPRLRKLGYRRLMLPGMAHCQGGPRPYAFGQSPAAPADRDMSGYDLRRTLEDWVEQGRAPSAMATHFIGKAHRAGAIVLRTD